MLRITDRDSGAILYSSSVKGRHPEDVEVEETYMKRVHILSMRVGGTVARALTIAYGKSGHVMVFVMEGALAITDDRHQRGFDMSAGSFSMHPLSGPLSINVDPTVHFLFIQLSDEHFGWIPAHAVGQDLMTSPMKLMLSDIIVCLDAYPIKAVVVELKILSLFFTLFAHLSDPPKKPISLPLKEHDVQKLEMAKQLIEKDIQASYTIMGIARQVGINDFKLKKGFKILFGTTIFSYRHRLRMEKARDMLLLNNKVSEVSDAVGYKNPHHFTAAFKKYFGVLPSSFHVKE